MTADDFGSVDIDLLADYIGDALDHDERERVARLVADDPQWRSAFGRLSPGMSEVGAELGAMGAASEPMPADLGVRLEAAFAAEFATHAGAAPDAAAAPGLIDAALAEPAEPHLVPSPSSRGDRHLASVPAEGSRGDRHLVSVPSGKDAPRRRRLRWAAPIAAAAGILAFAGFGTAYLTGRDDTAENTAGSAADAQAAPMIGGGSPLVGGLSDSSVASSGTDYSPTTLASEPSETLAAPKMPGFDAQSAAPAPASGQQGDSGTTNDKREAIRPNPLVRGASPELARLQDPAAMLACLEAIAQQNAAGPITVQSVDFARFAGAPAVIVRFSAGGASWAWAAGPDCGASGRGAQVRERVRVG